jgi:tRNA modification GTPase
LFRLIDTAGIRLHTTDEIEVMGIEKSIEKMNAADIVVYMFDVNTESRTQLEKEIKLFEEKGIRYMLVGNKIGGNSVWPEYEGVSGIYFISAKHNIGVDVLQTALYRSFVSNELASDNTIITNVRHYEALQQMLQSLSDVQQGLNDNIPGDLLSADIRQCLFYIGNITGEITNEDKLDFIFSKFCIGK